MPRRNVPRCARRTATADRIDHTDEINLTQGHAFGPWDLRSRQEFARLWSIWRDEITARWIDGFPGSRPMTMYLLGEIAAPAWSAACNWRPTRKIEGIDVVMPENWHKTHEELVHLDGLGLIDDEEWDRAIERLESKDAIHYERYRSIYWEQEAAGR